MAILRGIPDWQGANTNDEYSLLPVYQGIGQTIFLPKDLHIANDSRQLPDFQMEFVCPQGLSDPTSSLYTMLSMGLKRDTFFKEALAQLKKTQPLSTLFQANFAPKAYWNLETSASAPVVSQFAWENQNIVRIHQRLPEHVGNLLYQSLNDGHLIARSAVQCEFPSFLERIPAQVEFLEDQLLNALKTFLDTNKNIPLWKINAFFGQPLSALPLKLHTQTNEGMHFFSKIMTGLFYKQYGSFVPAISIADGPSISINKEPQPNKHVSWDLSDLQLVALPIMLSFDPFTEVQNIIKQQDISLFSSFTSVPPLPGDLLTQQIYIDTVLPPRIQDDPIVAVQLRTEAEVSFSGSAELKTLQLQPQPTTPPTVEFKYKDPHQMNYSYQTIIISPSSRISGKKYTDNQNYLLLDDQLFHDSFVTIRCTSQLLQQVELLLSVKGDPSFEGKSYPLNEQQDTLSLLLPIPQREGVQLEFIASSPHIPDATVTLMLPADQTQLDLFDFPEFGTHNVQIQVSFPEDISQAIFEFLPDGDNQQKTSLRFTPDTPNQCFTYSPTQLLRYRYRYRRQKADGSGPTPWSDELDPTHTLSLQA